jgi:hypothetical protein
MKTWANRCTLLALISVERRRRLKSWFGRREFRSENLEVRNFKSEKT